MLPVVKIPDHPIVRAAAAHHKAAQEAETAAKRAYYLAVLSVAADLGVTREEALAQLGLPRRTGFRRLRALGITSPR